MPLVKMKKVWTYCTYNKPFFLLILLLYGILNFFQDVYGDTGDGWILLIIFAVSILIIGYGMTITHDRINNGVRLPKIMIKEVMVLGVKSYIVFIVYLFIQGSILDWISSPFNFPSFELEEMLEYANFTQSCTCNNFCCCGNHPVLYNKFLHGNSHSQACRHRTNIVRF